MKLTCMDAGLLVQAAIKANKSSPVGWLDADCTLSQFRKRMNQTILIHEDYVESALSHIIELDGVKQWKHPDGLDLSTFIKKVTPPGKVWDSTYRCFKEKVK